MRLGEDRGRVPHGTLLKLYIPLRDVTHYPRIERVFLDDHPRGKGVRRITGEDGHPRLRNHGACIDAGINEMHGASVFGVFRLKRACVGMKPREVREE